jgi:SNF2 family DNA or RNA helicase
MKRINVEKKGNEWLVRFDFDYETKDFVKSLGFWFDGSRKLWYTTDATVAAKLDPNAAGHFAKQVEASKAVDADVDIPRPAGCEYLGYQKAGISYAMQRPNTLFADEMGLGKTIQAIGVINADPSVKSVCIVCPATIKLNWKRELQKWLVRPLSIAILESGANNSRIPIS